MMIRRNSRQRQLILDVMRGEGIHMNADQVYQKVKQADPSIGIDVYKRQVRDRFAERMIVIDAAQPVDQVLSLIHISTVLILSFSVQ